jgi:hypothetical protein
MMCVLVNLVLANTIFSDSLSFLLLVSIYTYLHIFERTKREDARQIER